MKWNLIANQFKTVVTFKNQTELALFLVEVAQIADRMNHHPDYAVAHCSELSLTVYSHDTGGISDRDLQLTQAISTCYSAWITQQKNNPEAV